MNKIIDDCFSSKFDPLTEFFAVVLSFLVLSDPFCIWNESRVKFWQTSVEGVQAH